jgi:hypothetical protein
LSDAARGQARGTPLAPAAEPGLGTFGLSLTSRWGEAYNEEAFRYLLALEQKRCERSRRPFLLLLAYFRNRVEPKQPVDPVVAGKLFSGLWQCVRETDFVGWFVEGRVAGAVMTQYSDTAGADVISVVTERVRTILDGQIREHEGGRLCTRVHWIPRSLRDGS